MLNDLTVKEIKELVGMIKHDDASGCTINESKKLISKLEEEISSRNNKKGARLCELVDLFTDFILLEEDGVVAYDIQYNEESNFASFCYKETDYSAREPWEYLKDRPINQELQARCYQSVIEAFKDKYWFKGVLFWDWMPRKDYGGKFNTDFTPQHKPAENTFRN